MKEIFKAIKALALFVKYTDMPRWMEIGYSILFWCIILTLLKAVL